MPPTPPPLGKEGVLSSEEEVGDATDDLMLYTGGEEEGEVLEAMV